MNPLEDVENDTNQDISICNISLRKYKLKEDEFYLSLLQIFLWISLMYFMNFYSHLGYIYSNNKEKKKRVSDLEEATTLTSEISRYT